MALGIKEELSSTIEMVEGLEVVARDAQSCKSECLRVWEQAQLIGEMLRSVGRIAISTRFLYERPFQIVVAKVITTLERALALVGKCRSRIFPYMDPIIIPKFRKVRRSLGARVEEMKWLLMVVDAQGGSENCCARPAVAPFGCSNPTFYRILSCIAFIQMGQLAKRIKAANFLVFLAQANYQNKKIILEERGFAPLLQLLEMRASPEAQIAAATALYHLADVQEMVRLIVDEGGVPIIVHVLGNSPTKVQIAVAKLIDRMVELHPFSQEEFAKAHVIRALVKLLSLGMVMNHNCPTMSFHSLAQITKQMRESSLSIHRSNSYPSLHHEMEMENEEHQVNVELKTNCACTLRKLARSSASNSKEIIETKGLSCLAKLIEKEKGDLQLNCLMSVMEITAIVESDDELRNEVYKANSNDAKAVVDQLLKLIEGGNQLLQIPAIKAIGSLARTFRAKDTHVISGLVAQINHSHQLVGTEVVISLRKFTGPDNYLNKEHSESIIKFGGITPLLKLMRANKESQLHGLILLCYLAIYGRNSESFEPKKVRITLEGAQCTIDRNSELRRLVFEAISHLLAEPLAYHFSF